MAKQLTRDDLQAAIAALADQFSGELGLAAVNVATGESVEWNAEAIFPTASVIKLAVLVEVYRRAATEGLDLQQRLELQADLRSAIRLTVAWLASGIMALTALPLLVTCLAEVLDGCGGIDDDAWLLIFGVVLLIASLLGGWFAWRRFRRRFVGLQETLEELSEDWVWMKERAEGGGRKENKGGIIQ